jgi:hypothetical protein
MNENKEVTATALQAAHLSSTAREGGANIPMAMNRRKRERFSIDQIDPEIFFSIFAVAGIER